MPGIARKGDLDKGAGEIIAEFSTDVFVNGLPVALVGSIQSPHPKGDKHKMSHIKVGSSSVFVNGKAVAYIGSETECGHDIATGSSDVMVPDGGGAGGGSAPSSIFSVAVPPENPVPLNSAQQSAVDNYVAVYTTRNNEMGISSSSPDVITSGNVTVNTAGINTANENDTEHPAIVALVSAVLSEGEAAWARTGKNQNIMQLYADVGCPQSSDSVAWCAAFVGAILKRAGYKYNNGGNGLSAGAYRNHGNAVSDLGQAKRGDIVCFKRDGGSGSHVVFFWGYDGNKISYVGGNQTMTGKAASSLGSGNAPNTVNLKTVAVGGQWTTIQAIRRPQK